MPLLPTIQNRQRKFRSIGRARIVLASIMLETMRSPNVTMRSVSFTLVSSADGNFTWVSSFDVFVGSHRSGRCSVVLVVEVENKEGGLRRRHCASYDRLHNDVKLGCIWVGKSEPHDLLTKRLSASYGTHLLGKYRTPSTGLALLIRYRCSGKSDRDETRPP